MSDIKIVQYGEWKIEVDIEETKRYYRSQKTADPQKYNLQANRNLAKYCAAMTDEEKSFFDSFGIDPVCTELDTLGASRKGEYPCGGNYYVCGRYLEHPDETVCTPEDLFDENGNMIEYPDHRVTIGIFQFDFQYPDNVFSDIPADLPDEFICISFWCEEMKWLLEEPCEEKMYEPPRFWEIRRKFKEYIDHKREDEKTAKAIKNEYFTFFEEHGISAEILSKKDLTKFKNQWLDHYSPDNCDKNEIRKICLSARRYTVFLWHLFSYEIVKCINEEKARAGFDAADKDIPCIFTDNLYDFGFKLDNISQITSDLLETFDDVMITAADFSWTYCKTHEEMLGPYFFKDEMK